MFFGLIIFIILWLFFYAYDYTVYQNIAVVLASVLAGLAILGALAVVEAIDKWTNGASIKWPNDVLIDLQKTAGILVETSWMGNNLEYAIMGIGVNVRPDSIPPAGEIDYPATCVESAVGERIDRVELLLDILAGVGRWYDSLDSPALQNAWQQRLAFRNQQVSISSSKGDVVGSLLGVTTDGRLRLYTHQGELLVIASGDVHMRSVDTHNKSTTLDG